MAVVHRIAPFFVWLWLSTLLGASTGVSVQRIYCYCLGQSVSTVFQTVHKCPAQHKAPIELPSCCAAATKACSAAVSIPDCEAADDCTDKTVKVFKLKFESLVESLFQKDFDAPIWFPADPSFKKLLRPVICSACNTGKAPPAPPPPLSGRMICLRHEMLRC